LFSSFDFEHHHIIIFLCSEFLDLLDFSLCPQALFGHFQTLRFFLCLSHLPPVWGVILVEVISKKRYQAQKGTANDIFPPCERIIKDGLSSSQMHAFRIGKPCFHANMQSDFSLFIQIKLSF